MSAYADTSFLVSLYVLDANSAHAAAQMKRAKLPMLLTALGEVELANALYLRLFRKELIPAKIHAAHALFGKDIEDGLFARKSLSHAVYERAQVIVRKHTARLGVRTLDVLHVASALALEADTFYTFDRNQGRLADAEGLAVLQHRLG